MCLGKFVSHSWINRVFYILLIHRLFINKNLKPIQLNETEQIQLLEQLADIAISINLYFQYVHSSDIDIFRIRIRIIGIIHSPNMFNNANSYFNTYIQFRVLLGSILTHQPNASNSVQFRDRPQYVLWNSKAMNICGNCWKSSYDKLKSKWKQASKLNTVEQFTSSTFYLDTACLRHYRNICNRINICCWTSLNNIQWEPSEMRNVLNKQI